MKCKVIKTTLNVDLSNYTLIEDTINIWLKQNPKIKIHYMSSAGLGTKTIISTILYE
ncbi:MAG: hypothetical protein JXA54_05610 [Candidatus Heimdallarchaeota archaeon]|nr:hypothetical protein [Candidatus Heimdallarchaeota archaeon]